jgi:hypothetical protein
MTKVDIYCQKCGGQFPVPHECGQAPVVTPPYDSRGTVPYTDMSIEEMREMVNKHDARMQVLAETEGGLKYMIESASPAASDIAVRISKGVITEKEVGNIFFRLLNEFGKPIVEAVQRAETKEI